MVPRERELGVGQPVARLSSVGQRTNPFPLCRDPRTASPQFQNMSAPKRDQLLATIVAREAARHEASSTSTKEKRSLAWDRWVRFLEEDLEYFGDPKMEKLEPWQRITVLSSFAQNMREARYSSESYDTLASTTVRGAVDYVAQAIRDDHRRDPRLDDDGKHSSILLQQYKGYKEHDKNVEQQKAIPPRVIIEMKARAVTEKDRHIADLAEGAWFFACRSCEYSDVDGYENRTRKTKLLCKRNIVFRDGPTIVDHYDPRLLTTAKNVSITFERQKNDEQWEMVTIPGSNPRSPLSAVQAWGRIVQRRSSYPGTNGDTPVNTVRVPSTRQSSSTMSRIKSTDVIQKLRDIVHRLGPDVLGFGPKDVGTHSIRSGAAMALTLDGVSPLKIMLIGRWKSLAFERYIQCKVELFSHDIEESMTRHLDWYTVPSQRPRSGHEPYDPFFTPTPQLCGHGATLAPPTPRRASVEISMYDGDCMAIAIAQG